jgi:hypothetical protein
MLGLRTEQHLRPHETVGLFSLRTPPARRGLLAPLHSASPPTVRTHYLAGTVNLSSISDDLLATNTKGKQMFPSNAEVAALMD